MDPGKGSKRRPTEKSKFDENFDRIFGEKKVTSGRRYYRWNGKEFVQVDNPPPPLPKDLRFEGTFVSPVDGSVISNRYKLLDHNARHDVTQVLPGMEQDMEAIRKDTYDKAFGKQAREQRIEDVKKAIENPVIKRRPEYAEDDA